MRLPLRQIVFWLHLSAAVLAGLVILTMAATGLALSFEAQVLAWADRAHRHVEPPPGAGATLPLERILGAVAAARPEIEATAVTVRRDPHEAWTVALGREGQLYVDPYSAEVIGPGATRVRRAMRWLTDLHRYLAASGEARERGKSITGAANLLFLFLLLSGLYIWVPRVWNRLHVHNAVWFRRGVRAKVRDFNWHHVFGIWALLPLAAIVVSALPISYRWAGDLVLRVTGSPAAESPSAPRAGSTGGNGPGALATLDLAGLDRALDRAAATVPGWRSMTVRLPPRDGQWAVSVDRAARRGRPDLRDALVVDRASGQLAEHEPFATQSLGRRTRSWMRWIHTGEAGGLAGQAVGALACMATLLLGWTGYALALRRLFAWRRRRAFARASVSAVASPSRDPGLSPQTLSNSLPIPPEG